MLLGRLAFTRHIVAQASLSALPLPACVSSLALSHLDCAHERVVTVLQELGAEVSEEEPHVQDGAAMDGQLPGSLPTLRHPPGLLSQI